MIYVQDFCGTSAGLHVNFRRIIRAIDVGYCNTKYSIVNSSTTDIPCSHFPSATPRASGREIDDGIFKKRNTAKMEVGGVEYEIGREALMAVGNNYERTFDVVYTISIFDC